MIKNFLKKKGLIEVIFILILGLTPLLWYQSGSLAFGHDMGFPLNPIEYFRDRLFAWTERLSFGSDQSMNFGAYFIHGFEALIKWLGFSLQATQKISFVFWFVTPGLAMYYFIYSLKLQKKLPFMSLIASIFYMFNHFLLQGWFVAERTKFSIIVALPLVLSFLIRGLQQKMNLLKAAVLVNLILFFFNGGGGQGLPLYGGLIVSVVVCLIYFGTLKRTLLLTALILFLFVILNFYWVLPFCRFASAGYSQNLASSGGVEGVLGWTREISKQASFLNLLRLQGIPDWHDNLTHSYANLFLENSILIIISFLWPLFAFASILLAKSRQEKKYALFFILLVLISIFFTAGAHPPMGKLYEAFVRHIPFFAIFRTPFYKFGYALWFAYAFLISFAINKLLVKLKKKWVYSSLAFIFIVFMLFYNYPFFTGNFFNWKPSLSTMVKVPDYIFKFGKWADSLEKDERVLMLPPLNKGWKSEVYNWQYWSLAPVPSLLTRKSVIVNTSELNPLQNKLIESLHSAIWERDENLAKRLTSILNIKYFLIRQDFFYNLEWNPTTSPDEWQKRLENLSWIKPEQKFGEWLVYRLGMSEFLPRFYLPKKFTYVQGGSDTLVDAIDFEADEIKRAVYLTKYTDVNLDGAGKPDSFFVAGQCVKCNPLEKAIIKLPYVWFLPDSILYPLVEWKEARLEKKIRDLNDPGQAIDLNLGLATKRMAELNKLAEEEKNNEEKSWMVREIIKKYQTRIENISYWLSAIEEEDKNINEILLRIGDYFEKYQEVIATVRLKTFTREADARLKNAAWKLDDFLIRIKGKRWTSEENVKRYFLDIAQEAEYELFIKNEGVGDYFIQDPLDPIIFELDGKLASESGRLRDDGWVLVDKVKMTKGKHKLAVILPEAKNLVEKENLLLKQEKNEKGKISFPINNFDYNGVYKVSFDYQFSGEIPAEFMVAQDTDKENEELGKFEHDIMTDLKKYDSSRTFKTFFEPGSGAKEATLEFIFEAGAHEASILEVKKIKVERVWSPKVIMKMVNNDISKESLTAREIPKIVFRKINPTRYEVEVEKASKPYTLVFNESFHKGWQAYIQTSNSNHQTDGDEIASYFDGEIREKPQQDNFWPKSILGNWGDQPISENKHGLANGYANSWQIAPEDSGGRESYKLIIEFWPQKLFYIGIAVSVLSLLGCLGCLAWPLIKKKRS